MEPAEHAPAGSLHRPDSSAFEPSTVMPDRLWTPWRLQYVVGGVKEEGCLFCNRLAAGDDVSALILHRGERAFIIMNLYPYNTGHVMIVPNDHVSSPEDLDPRAAEELALMRGPLLRALRRALSPEGFNLGLNVGSVAGAGVAAHLHEHVVPRWQGDANFMPILAATMVMPELIPATYAKLRGELLREFVNVDEAVGVIVSRDGKSVLVSLDARLPRFKLIDGEPIWKSVVHQATAFGATDAELVGWAGDEPASQEPAAFLLVASSDGSPTPSSDHVWLPTNAVTISPDASIIRATLDRYFVEST